MEKSNIWESENGAYNIVLLLVQTLSFIDAVCL